MNWIAILLASQTSASLGITATTAEPERMAVLRQYISPAPGELAEIAPAELRDRGPSEPMRARGFITLSPPKGSCFTVTMDRDRPDRRVCRQERLSFTANDLHRDGSLQWQISTGASDPGFTYRWPTPHRRGQVIKAAERPDTLYDEVLIVQCHAEPITSRRRILLQMGDGRLWQINLPRRDTLAPQPEDQPNLFVDEIAEFELPTDGPRQRHRPDYQRARENAALQEHVTTYWAMPARGAFQMSADHFHSIDSPSGLRGQCRYRFTGAPEDPESGWIECHHTAEFDVILLPLACARLMK